MHRPGELLHRFWHLCTFFHFKHHKEQFYFKLLKFLKVLVLYFVCIHSNFNALEFNRYVIGVYVYYHYNNIIQVVSRIFFKEARILYYRLWFIWRQDGAKHSNHIITFQKCVKCARTSQKICHYKMFTANSSPKMLLL